MISTKNLLPKTLFALIALLVPAMFVPAAYAETGPSAESSKSKLGVITGVVRDSAGNPISGAFVAIFRLGTSKLLKQVRSASDGSFVAKIIPGKYTVLAIAEGYNSVTLQSVEVNQSAKLVYGFKLQASGSGNTLPEKRTDRKNPKWNIRANNQRRSIYQTTEGEAPVDEIAVADNAETEKEEITSRSGQTVVETYFADSGNASFAGVNFATLVPVGENAEVVIAGQSGVGKNAPSRISTNLKFRPNDDHQIRLNTSVAKFGDIEIDKETRSLGQFSVQALDEWNVREGIIIVFGIDYSRFFGAGDDFAVSPRFGFQYDLDSKTRFRSAYTTQTEQTTWQSVIDLEGTQVLFREPVAMQDFSIEDEKPLMNKSSRLEFSVERILDNDSTLEANVFFDTVTQYGVGLVNLPISSLSGDGFNDFVASQQGGARGIRVVYNRRLNGMFSTSAGYSFGNGQKISEEGLTNPADVFDEDYFSTFYGQFDADFKTGTSVRTIFRLSPQATIFAIDPFQGRLAIYDPGLSILVTQSLPNLGLPFRARAMLDARNLLGFQTGLNGEEGSLKLGSQQRVLRGGISVRF